MDTPFPAHKHNHAHCRKTAINKAESICTEKALRFTPTRKRVLELIWSSHEPVSAYDLLRNLREEKQNAEAPTIYRALEFLQSLSLVHKIETLNAFVGCDSPEHNHISQFLICTSCNRVAELVEPRVAATITDQATSMGFAIDQQTIEVLGTCADCVT